MHIRTLYRQRRGNRKFSEAVAVTGVNKGVLSRIERGEQFPKAEQCRAIAEFYDPDAFRLFNLDGYDFPGNFLCRLYPASVLRLLQLERNCACGCGKALSPDSLRTKRYLDGHRRHRRASS